MSSLSLSLKGKVRELEEEVREKQDEIRQLATELDHHQQQPSSPPLHPGCDVSLQTSLSPSPGEIQDSENANSALPHSEVVQFPPGSIPNPFPTPSSATTSDKRVKKDRPSSPGERRVKSAGRTRRVKSPVKRASAAAAGVDTAEGDVSLDNEMRLAGIELTDPYDSSEGLGFSDTNMEGSSLLSLEEAAPQRDAGGEDEGGRGGEKEGEKEREREGEEGGREGAGDGEGEGGREGAGEGGGEGGREGAGEGEGGRGTAAKVTSLISSANDPGSEGWVVGQKEGERVSGGPSEGEIDGKTDHRTMERSVAAREGESPDKSHDLTGESHDKSNDESHDLTGESHDKSRNESHDLTGESHDKSRDESHDLTGESHDIGMQMIDLEALTEADSLEDVVYSSDSDTDLTPRKGQSHQQFCM